MLYKVAITSERKLKGGVLGEGMVKRFQKEGVFPSLNDRDDVFREKLNYILKELRTGYQASSDSLRTGLIISPLDIEEAQERGGDFSKSSTEDLLQQLQSLEGQ